MATDGVLLGFLEHPLRKNLSTGFDFEISPKRQSREVDTLRERSRQSELLLHVNTSLSEQLRHRVCLHSRSVE
jgi:hypothetical protein